MKLTQSIFEMYRASWCVNSSSLSLGSLARILPAGCHLARKTESWNHQADVEKEEETLRVTKLLPCLNKCGLTLFRYLCVYKTSFWYSEH